MKKLLPILIAALMVIPTAMTAQKTKTRQWKGAPYKLSTTTEKGDVNGDGGVSITDVTTLVDVILTGLPQNTDTSIYDINGDGDVTISDVTVLVDMILNGNGSDNGSGIGDTSQAYLTCPDDNHPHMIDLGLPSGTLWACCNVGSNDPKEYGNDYAWGETETKEVFNHVTYKYSTGEDTDGDGWYNDWHNGTYGVWINIGENISNTEYDVAHIKWGGKWQMPSKDQVSELQDHVITFEDLFVEDEITCEGFYFENGGFLILPILGYWTSSAYIYSENQSWLLSCTRSWHRLALYSQASRERGNNVRPVWVP